jgi:hypothetical protein
MVTPKTMTIQQEVSLNPDFRRVGGIFIDGLTSWNDWIMGDMAQRTATQQLSGEKTALGGTIESDGLIFGSNNRAHYGFAQIRSQFWLTNLTTIPNLILPPIMTALEDRGSDEKNALVYGPKIAGSAKTYAIPSWVGNCLRTAVVRGEWRLYLRTHAFPEEGGIPHFAKIRRLDELLDQTITDYADRYKDLQPVAGLQQSTLDPALIAELTGEVVPLPSTQGSTTPLTMPVGVTGRPGVPSPGPAASLVTPSVAGKGVAKAPRAESADTEGPFPPAPPPSRPPAAVPAMPVAQPRTPAAQPALPGIARPGPRAASPLRAPTPPATRPPQVD